MSPTAGVLSPTLGNVVWCVLLSKHFTQAVNLTAMESTEMMQEFAENAQYLSALSAISVEPLQIHLDQQMRTLPLPNAQPRSTALPQTAETFASLVNEPMGLTLFRFHLRQIQSLEYLSFLHEVEAYESYPACTYRNALALHIYETYVTPTARLPLGIPALIRQSIEVELDRAFKHAQSAAQPINSTTYFNTIATLNPNATPNETANLSAQLFARLQQLRAASGSSFISVNRSNSQQLHRSDSIEEEIGSRISPQAVAKENPFQSSNAASNQANNSNNTSTAAATMATANSKFTFGSFRATQGDATTLAILNNIGKHAIRRASLLGADMQPPGLPPPGQAQIAPSSSPPTQHRMLPSVNTQSQSHLFTMPGVAPSGPSNSDSHSTQATIQHSPFVSSNSASSSHATSVVNSRRSSRRPTLLAVHATAHSSSFSLHNQDKANKSGHLIDRDVFARAKTHILRVLSLSLFTSFMNSPSYSLLQRLRIAALKPCSVDDLSFVRLLGEGGFGRVFAVLKKDTRAMYACKTMNKMGIMQKKREKLICNERDVLSVVHSPFVVELQYSFHDDSALYMLMDLMTGGELQYHLRRCGRFPEQWVRFYGAGILLALEYLHSQQIVYRDLKPENVMLDDAGYTRLTDLGLCAFIKPGEMLHQHCGTRSYMAPEQTYGDTGYGKEVDWWAFGVTLYYLITGTNPFSRRKEKGGQPQGKSPVNHNANRRPSAAVPADEEKRGIAPLIKRKSSHVPTPISVTVRKASVQPEDAVGRPTITIGRSRRPSIASSQPLSAVQEVEATHSPHPEIAASGLLQPRADSAESTASAQSVLPTAAGVTFRSAMRGSDANELRSKRFASMPTLYEPKDASAIAQMAEQAEAAQPEEDSQHVSPPMSPPIVEPDPSPRRSILRSNSVGGLTGGASTVLLTPPNNNTFTVSLIKSPGAASPLVSALKKPIATVEESAIFSSGSADSSRTPSPMPHNTDSANSSRRSSIIPRAATIGSLPLPSSTPFNTNKLALPGSSPGMNDKSPQKRRVSIGLAVEMIPAPTHAPLPPPSSPQPSASPQPNATTSPLAGTAAAAGSSGSQPHDGDHPRPLMRNDSAGSAASEFNTRLTYGRFTSRGTTEAMGATSTHLLPMSEARDEDHSDERVRSGSGGKGNNKPDEEGIAGAAGVNAGVGAAPTAETREARAKRYAELEARMRSIVEQLSFPSYVSSDARSLITSLLVFDPTLRLGHRGADEIKSHAFFSTLDWSRMQRRLLAPPFVPSQTDVNASFIESAESGLAKTTRRTIRTDKTLERVSEEVFKNFSYTNPYAYQTELARSVHDRWQLIYGDREHPNQ